MKFLADECCDAGLVLSLREDGHDVLYVLERNPGVSDDDVLTEAYVEESILVTEDKDFADLVYRFKKPARGVILIRMDVNERHMKWRRLKKLIRNHEKRLPSHFVVVDSNKFRFRPLLFAV